jgi:hypothetical protein
MDKVHGYALSSIHPEEQGSPWGGKDIAQQRAKYVRWRKPIQDSTSYNTGASIFDFEAHGKPEACMAASASRVHAGLTGEVLFSEEKAGERVGEGVTARCFP